VRTAAELETRALLVAVARQMTAALQMAEMEMGRAEARTREVLSEPIAQSQANAPPTIALTVFAATRRATIGFANDATARPRMVRDSADTRPL
jgi:hypothetical protein